MWRFHKSQFANVIITITIVTLMGAGLYIERLNENLEAISLKLGTYAIEFSEHLEANHSKAKKYSVEKIVKYAANISDQIPVEKIVKYAANISDQIPMEKIVKYAVNIPDQIPLEKIVKYAINIPVQILDNESNKYNYSNNCSQLPKATDIVLDSKYWQLYKSSKGLPLYLYSAYYDKRKKLNGDAFIRIMATLTEKHYKEEYLCNIWYIRNNEINTISSSISIDKLKLIKKSKKYHPYFLNCKIPNSHINEEIFGVSVTKSKCEKVTNILRVNNQKENDTKKYFGVCLKGMEFPFDDKSIFLVEWLELLKILKVDKVFMYELIVHPNMSKTLQHYRDEGFIDIMPLSLPGNQPNSPEKMHKYLYSNMNIKRAQEKLPYNDCLYRSMNMYKFLAILDLDEILIPVKYHTWKELFEYLEKTYKKLNPSAYTFTRLTSIEEMQQPHGYSSGIPEYMYMLQHVYHSTKPSRVKSVLATDSVYATDNHYPMLCFNDKKDNAGDDDDDDDGGASGGVGKCRVEHVHHKHASVLHFRGSCKKGRDKWCDLDDAVKDINMWKYKDELIRRTTNKLKLLKLI